MPITLSPDNVLNNTRFNRIVRDTAADLVLRQPLLFYDRTPRVDADDAEIVTTFTGKVYAADLIADDQEAAVYSGGSWNMAINNIPNIKSGIRLGQAQLARLDRLRRNRADAGESDFFANWVQNTAERLVLSVKQRINALLCAMQMDSLTLTRFGIRVDGPASWGMPSGLKATPSTAWSDPASTPVTDILTMRDYAATTYGESYNRITLGRATLNSIFKTTEFKNLMSGLFRTNIPATAFNANQAEMRDFLSRQLDGMEIETNDTTYTVQAQDGTESSPRVQPLNKVILSDTQDDNNPAAMDFANAIVTESIAGSLTGVEGFDGPTFGPIGYYTGRPDLNPPDIRGWGVARGWPRKFRLSATAVLTVG